MMKHKTAFIFLGAALLLLIAYIGYHLLSSGSRQTTDDAYINADSVMVSARVAGQITQVLVDDNQQVKAGQLLAEIDARDFQAAKAAAEANVNATRAELKNLTAKIERQKSVIDQALANTQSTAASLKFAQSNAERYSNLSKVGAGTQEERQKTATELQKWRASSAYDRASWVAATRELDVLKAEYEKRVATLAQNEADLLQANLNLSYTRITAPFDGMVGKRTVRVGAYITPGSPLLAVVPLENAYVIANYRETQITKMRPNQAVEIQVDSVPDRVFKGHIASIAPATGMSFSAIAPDNATGNFTKVVQRVPVKIMLDKDQPQLDKMRVGLSVIVSINTAQKVESSAPFQGQAENYSSSPATPRSPSGSAMAIAAKE
ncbi:secretion protein [Salmonella enterica subsp. enterica serovar Choleraesuis]|nr:secretion protein [Salmonella enterica subsp. enterica serovar Choleraesuis]